MSKFTGIYAKRSMSKFDRDLSKTQYVLCVCFVDFHLHYASTFIMRPPPLCIMCLRLCACFVHFHLHKQHCVESMVSTIGKEQEGMGIERHGIGRHEIRRHGIGRNRKA